MKRKMWKAKCAIKMNGLAWYVRSVTVHCMNVRTFNVLFVLQVVQPCLYPFLIKLIRIFDFENIFDFISLISIFFLKNKKWIGIKSTFFLFHVYICNIVIFPFSIKKKLFLDVIFLSKYTICHPEEDSIFNIQYIESKSLVATRAPMAISTDQSINKCTYSPS